jgi:cell division septum initiation protein DivIVA
VELQQLIEQLRSTLDKARSMPMSSSVVVNKSEVLAQIDALEAALPAAFAKSERLADRDGVATRAREEADRVVAEATSERDRLVSESEVVRAERDKIEQLRTATERECEQLRRETDEYVDGRLANLEVSLNKTLDAVSRGRQRLQGRSDLDPLRASDDGQEFAFPD